MTSLIDALKKMKTDLLAPKGGSVLGIDVSSSTIKVVQVGKKHGKIVLETYGELALGPYAGIAPGKATILSPQKLSEALVDLLREAKTSTTVCGVSIPLASSLINIIQMPDAGEKRLHDMVPLEVRKYIPVNIAEVMLDWRVVPSLHEAEESEGSADSRVLKKIDVLTVAIHQETITRYQEVIRSAKLNVSFLEIEVFSTIRAVLEETLAPTLIIDFGAGTTKIYVVDRKVLRESHIVNRGSQAITDAIANALGVPVEKAEEMKKTFGVLKDSADPTVPEVVSLVLDGILAEAHRVMLNYEKKESRNVGNVILTGGGALLRGLTDRAQITFQTSVVRGNPFSKLETPAFLQDVLQEVGPEFAVAIGVALRKLEEGE